MINKFADSSRQSLPHEVIDVIWFIQEEFQKPVWLLGLKGLYALGVPFYRTSDVIEIYSPITKPERSKLDDYLRGRYTKMTGRRSDRGTSYAFPHSCNLEVNRVDEYLETLETAATHAPRQNHLEITKGINILVPQIEDLLLMILIKGRTKDLRDVRHVLRRFRSRIDMNRLENTAREFGVETKLKRLERVA